MIFYRFWKCEQNSEDESNKQATETITASEDVISHARKVTVTKNVFSSANTTEIAPRNRPTISGNIFELIKF